MHGSFLVRRIAHRTGLAIWRHRLAWLAAGLAAAAVGGYQFNLIGANATTGDCADTTIAAVTRADDATARAAFACLGPGMRTTTEDQFVAGIRQQAKTNGQVNRVADEHTPDGGRIVFFTVEAAQAPAVGYIVYL
ncbi:MAG TPA: hypothetical protein VF937_07180, partial [Chloroflexota bacterium]